MGLTPDSQRRWRETPSWIRILLSEERVETTTRLSVPQAVEVVAAHMRRLFPGARVEVETQRGRLPLDDPHHYVESNVHEMRDYLVEPEPDRALGTRHWSEP